MKLQSDAQVPLARSCDSGCLHPALHLDRSPWEQSTVLAIWVVWLYRLPMLLLSQKHAECLRKDFSSTAL